MTYCHACPIDVMGVVEIYSLSLILQSEAMKALDIVGGYLPFWCNIFLGLFDHTYKQI